MGTRHRGKLRNKVIVACILFAVFLSILIGGMGYRQYRMDIEESYRNYARTLVSIVVGNIDRAGLEEAIRSKEENGPYMSLQLEINNIKNNSDVQYLYIIYYPNGIEEGTIAYAMNGYTDYEQNYEADTIKYLGDLADEGDFGTEYRGCLKESVALGDEEIRFIDNKTQVTEGFGGAAEYVKTAYGPVRNAEGELICVVCADISMTRIYNSLRSYLTAVAVGASVVAVVFLMVFLLVMERQVIGPIRQIAKRADAFVLQSYDVSDPSQLHFEEIRTYTRDEIQTLAESLNHTMRELIRYMVDLREMSANQERISAELDVARQIQQNLYPCVYPAFPERGEFDIYGSLESARGAGGDFYDFFLIDNSHLCVMAGSVMGMGVPATMFAAIITTVMKNFARLGYSASRVMAETNNQVGVNNRAELKASAFLGILDLAGGRMEYAAAGDIRPLVKRAGEEFQMLVGHPGIQLGAMENVPYARQMVGLVQGDMIFLYSPGVARATDEKGNVYSDSYVLERINQITTQEADLGRMVGAMRDDVRAFRGDKEQEYDETMVLLRYYGG